MIDLKDVKNLSDKEKLDILFKYVINTEIGRGRLLEEVFERQSGLKDDDIHHYDASRLYQFMIKLFGYNEKPKVISNEKFKDLDAPILYRGVRKQEHAQNLINGDDYHYGAGTQYDGLYSSKEKRIASSYGNFIFKMKLSEDAKVSKVVYLLDDWYYRNTHKSYDKEKREKAQTLVDFIKCIKSKTQRELFMYIFSKDRTTLLIYLGFDALIKINGDYVIFNRGKIVFSEREYNKISKTIKKESDEQTLE